MPNDGVRRRNRRRTDPLARFWAKVREDDETGCWDWLGAITDRGYGSFAAPTDGASHMTNAHGYSYRTFIGPVPAGLELDHLCRNRRCVAPWHLEPVTRRVNTLRGEGKAAVIHRSGKCGRGHLMTPENTLLVSTRPGHRICAECKRARDRAYALRRKES